MSKVLVVKGPNNSEISEDLLNHIASYLKNKGLNIEVKDSRESFLETEAKFKLNEGISLSDQDLEKFNNLSDDKKENIIKAVSYRLYINEIFDYGHVDSLINDEFKESLRENIEYYKVGDKAVFEGYDCYVTGTKFSNEHGLMCYINYAKTKTELDNKLKNSDDDDEAWYDELVEWSKLKPSPESIIIKKFNRSKKYLGKYFDFGNEVSKEKYDPTDIVSIKNNILYVNFKNFITIKINNIEYIIDQITIRGNEITYIREHKDFIKFELPKDKIKTLETDYFDKETLELLVNDYFGINTFKIN